MSLWTLSLGDVLVEKARSSGTRLAAVCGDTRLTYAELNRRVDALAGGLAANGVGIGSRVLWLGQNCHRTLEVLLACAKLGAACCPANWRQTPAELAATIEDFGADVVVVQPSGIEHTVAEARARISSPGIWLAAGEGSAYEELVASATPLPDADIDPALAVLGIYTSAFDGKPRCALLAHTAIINQDLVMASIHQIDQSTVYLNCGPLFHIGTLMSTLATFHLGGVNVFIAKADPEEICRVVERGRVTRAFIVEPTRQQIVDLVAERPYDLSTLLGFPGSPQWEATVTRDPSPWGTWIGGYGQTETMGHVTFRCIAAPSVGEHGRTCPELEVRIADDELSDLADGEVGEIVVRGPTVMVGYHGRDEENELRQAGGWHRTRDMGRRESDGSVTFVGPKARMLKSGVENIYPSEVEACIREHPDVLECAVMGVADPVWVQSVKAIVVVRPGADLDAQAVIEHCRARIASYKKPKFVEFVDALPRNGPAVDYDELDRRFGGGGYPGGSVRALG